VYAAEKGSAPREIERLDLPKDLSIRETTGDGVHPLDSVQLLIVGGAGPGFIARMAARGIDVVITSQTDPGLAVAQHCARRLPRRQSRKSMQESAGEAAEFLKAMANDTRLVILCALAQGEKSVSELEDGLGLRQSRVSQQLARLRRAGLVANRPQGASVYYSLASPEVRVIVDTLYDAYCRKHRVRTQH
jgi:DNA-binding transcriptional ArsR family regulator